MKSRLIFPEPIARYAYVDKIQFWAIDPLNQYTLDLLEAECGKGGLHVSDERARFDYRYCQRVQLNQPTENALPLLAQRSDVHINGVEIALDLIFKNWFEMERAIDFLHRHLVRRWHGSRQEIRVYRDRQHAADDDTGQCRYDAGRSAPNRIVVYPENFTRVTGELHCLHIEWRAKGVRATRAAGISTPEDLLKFSHREFWQERLRLRDVDRRKLGLMIRNQSTGRRHRTPKTIQKGKFQYPIEARTGEGYARMHETIQELIHHMKSICRIDRALIPISNQMLLPPQHTHLLYMQTTRQLDPVLASKSYLAPIEELSSTDMGTNLLLDLAKLPNDTGIPLLALDRFPTKL